MFSGNQQFTQYTIKQWNKRKKRDFHFFNFTLGYQIHKKSPCNEILLFNKTNKLSDNSVNRSC